MTEVIQLTPTSPLLSFSLFGAISPPPPMGWGSGRGEGGREEGGSFSDEVSQPGGREDEDTAERLQFAAILICITCILLLPCPTGSCLRRRRRRRRRRRQHKVAVFFCFLPSCVRVCIPSSVLACTTDFGPKKWWVRL